MKKIAKLLMLFLIVFISVCPNSHQAKHQSSLYDIERPASFDHLHQQQHQQQNDIKCRYFLVEKALLKQARYLDKLFKINSGEILINSNLVRIHEQSCFASIDSIEKYLLDDDDDNDNDVNNDQTRSIIYGVDLSANNLDDAQLESIFLSNHAFKYYSNTIRYLNLNRNNFVSLNSNQLNNMDLDEFNYLNENMQKPNETFYLLNRFMNLEVLTLDFNMRLNIRSLNVYSILLKNLKVLSLNKCNLGESLKRNEPMFNKNELKPVEGDLIYLGLSENRLTDSSSSLIFNVLLPSSIQTLDLSLNKLTKLDLSFRSSIKRLNLEQNLIDSFSTRQFTSNIEINLMRNLIRNTSQENFVIRNSTLKVSMKLADNPLVCDCNSIWLLDEIQRLKETQLKANWNKHGNKMLSLTRKKFKQQQQQHGNQRLNQTNGIKMIYKRAVEEISTHHEFVANEADMDAFLIRQKRIKSLANLNLIRIVDLEHLLCNFIDVQNFNETSSLSNDNKHTYELRTFDLNGFESELRKQNFYANSIKFNEKPISTSNAQDFVCAYDDHCRPDLCNCCEFVHCHCRSICPRQCSCYYDAHLMQNIIDCSSMNLIDIPSAEIESATDMRLNSNSLKLIKPHSFFGLSQLKYLYLQSNQLSYLTQDAFDDLKDTLKLLNLANNQLTYLSGDEFVNLSQLRVLILSKNPLKDIESLYMIDFYNKLPKLSFMFITQTNLSDVQMSKLIESARNRPNVTINYKYELITTTTRTTRTSTTTVTPPTTTPTTSEVSTISSHDVHLRPESTKSVSSTERVKFRMDQNVHGPTHESPSDQHQPDEDTSKPSQPKTFRNQVFNFLKWYYFPISVLILCLILSLIIVLTVVVVTRKYETDHQRDKKTFKRAEKTSSSRDSMCLCCCFGSQSKRQHGDSLSSSSYFSPSSTEYYDEYEDLDDESEIRVVHKCLCIKRPVNCHSSSLDSLEYGNDSASVPVVSRNIDKLNLNVYIYYNLLDSNYVNHHLLPLLKRCLILAPETKYILMPQTETYVSSLCSEHQMESPMSPNGNNHNKSTSSSGSETFMKTNYLSGLKSSSQLVANIYIISENFQGYKVPIESLVSLRLKNSTSTNTTTTASSLLNTNTSFNSGTSSNKVLKSKSFYHAENSFKNSFKIYISNQLNSATNPYNHLNNMKLYERPNSNRQSNQSDDLYAPLSFNTRNSFQIANDLFSSYGYNDKLQFKLERYLQSICLRSNTFSRTNFSYVNYTKR